MLYHLDEWTFDYFNQIDLTDVPSLEKKLIDKSVIISVNYDNVETLEDTFLAEIAAKGLTDDQEHCTEFGKKLYQIYDDMVAQANEYFENGMPRHLSSRELTDKEREENIDIL